jgi:hypothetical protein
MREDEALQQRRNSLERERSRVQSEIHDYPQPIPACDGHFNSLIERRTRIARELLSLDEAPRPDREA